jgi:hypothetical protein
VRLQNRQHTNGGARLSSRERRHAIAARSLLEDGEFVRVAFREFNEAWAAKFEACLRAAEEAGELAEDGQRRDLRAWFVHHLALGLMLYLNPKVPAINYQASGKTLVEETARFALRGAGLKEEAIKRHYKPKAPGRLRLLAACRLPTPLMQAD